MEFTEYLANVEKKLQRYFDIEKDYIYKEIKIDLFAKYFVRNERYIMTKKATVYGIESNEYCLLKHYQELNLQDLEEFIDCLKSAVEDFVNPHEEHMCSKINGIIVVDQSCSQDLINIVKKFKFHKGFAFGFKGWVDIGLILVILEKGEVIANKKGKEAQKVYQV